MRIGLKNSLDILSDVSPIVDFAVNEQCAQHGECQAYENFIALNKPVFHIEYPLPLNAQAMNGASCKGTGVAGLSTIMKDLQLNGMSYYCDGSYVDTPTLGGTSPPRPSQPPKPPSPPKTSSSRTAPMPTRTSSSRPQPSSTKTSTMLPSRTSSAQRPTSTSGGGGGCRSKHCEFAAMTVKLSDNAKVAVYVQRRLTTVLLPVLVVCSRLHAGIYILLYSRARL